MFIDQNYSVNNEQPAGPYNSTGWPLHLGARVYPQIFEYLVAGDIDITYSCKTCEETAKSNSSLAK
jgi:hypothetical protein